MLSAIYYLLPSQFVRLCVTVRMRDAHKMPSENKSLSASHTRTYTRTHTRTSRSGTCIQFICVPTAALSLDVCRLISVCPSEQPAAHPHQGDPLSPPPDPLSLPRGPSLSATPFLHPLGARILDVHCAPWRRCHFILMCCHLRLGSSLWIPLHRRKTGRNFNILRAKIQKFPELKIQSKFITQNNAH